jgi:hypothetical protein
VRPLINTAIGVSGVGVRLAEAGISIQPRSNAVVTAGIQWNRGSSRPTLSIGYTARTGPIQSALRAVSSASGVASSSFMMSTSTAFTHDGSVAFHPSARTGYAGLYGTVFIDRDGDGVFSDGDDVVSDAHLAVGAFRTATDIDGEYRVWGMQPYESVEVAIDSARTPDPSLTTSQAGIVVRPAPNVARRLDIALVQTSELIGTITAEPAVPTIAGVSLDITNLDTGDVTSTVTFSDGLFYVSRLRPGRYRIAVSHASLDAIGSNASPAARDFTISTTGDEPVIELEPIHLSRR